MKKLTISLGICILFILMSTTSFGAQCSSNVCSSATNLTIIGKAVNLIAPRNQSGSSNGTIIFTYNVTASNNISACSLRINGTVNQTNTSVTRSINSTFELTSLKIGSYNWSINCTDTSNNVLESPRRIFVIFNTTGFTTTDLTIVNITNITNFFISTGNGKINFSSALNMYSGYNFSSFASIISNRIELNGTGGNAIFNISAQLTLESITFTNPQALIDGAVCPSDICTEISFSGNIFIFNVTHFTIYSSRETPADTGGGGGGGGGGLVSFLQTRAIESITGGKLYDIIVTANKNRYQQNDQLKAQVFLYNYNSFTERDVIVLYYLVSPTGKIYSSSKRTIKEVPQCAINNRTGICSSPSYSFITEAQVPPSAEIGEWKIFVEKETITGFDTFYVYSVPTLSIGRSGQPITISYGWLSLIILFFLLLNKRSRRRTKSLIKSILKLAFLPFKILKKIFKIRF